VTAFVPCTITKASVKAEWISELWLAFDSCDDAVVCNAATHCKQFLEALECIHPRDATGSRLRSTRKNVSSAVERLEAR